MATSVRSPMGLIIQNLMNGEDQANYKTTSICIEGTKNIIALSLTTQRQTYLQINPSVNVNNVYEGDSQIPEYARIV